MTMLLLGDPADFAIETAITEVLERPSQLGIGYFIIHVAGHSFGVRNPQATLLSCSFDAIKRRLSQRGMHEVPFGAESDVINLFDAVRAATYDVDRQDESFFGLQCAEFCDVLVSKEIIWAPDGDEAFDDGSHVLQFDVGDSVRLVAFKNLDNANDALQTVVEKWIPADDFYQLLENWKTMFEVERNKMMVATNRNKSSPSVMD